MQTDTVAVPVRSEPVWGWRFHSPESLREDGLEQYTAFLDSAGISKYGEFVIGDEVNGKSHMCAARKRAEIDRCMALLPYPYFRRILDWYYCQGKSCEHTGWCEVAERMGLRGDPKSRWDRDTFEKQLSMGIDRLWRIHAERSQRAS